MADPDQDDPDDLRNKELISNNKILSVDTYSIPGAAVGY